MLYILSEADNFVITFFFLRIYLIRCIVRRDIIVNIESTLVCFKGRDRYFSIKDNRPTPWANTAVIQCVYMHVSTLTCVGTQPTGHFHVCICCVSCQKCCLLKCLHIERLYVLDNLLCFIYVSTNKTNFLWPALEMIVAMLICML